MFALLMIGHKYLSRREDGSHYWTPSRADAYRFQDGTSARSYRDALGLPAFVSVVDERGYAYRG